MAFLCTIDRRRNNTGEPVGERLDQCGGFIATNPRSWVERLAPAAARWRLTSKQSAALVTLLDGDANKSIAEKHQCAESTIEIHVTALLAKAGVANRSALIAKFWSD